MAVDNNNISVIPELGLPIGAEFIEPGNGDANWVGGRVLQRCFHVQIIEIQIPD